MTARRRRADVEGWLWAIVRDDRSLRLRLFRWITVARVRLDDVRALRQRGQRDLAALARDIVRRPFRCGYWPHGWMARGGHRSTAYVLHTRRGGRIYLRLRPGFHYRLRAAVGAARAARYEPPVHVPEWSAREECSA
jgi:hypothetical protein